MEGSLFKPNPSFMYFAFSFCTKASDPGAKQVRNTERKQFEPTHLPSFDTFTSGVNELGYFDVFKKGWSELLHPTSLFVDVDDSLELSVRVKLLSGY